jgi:putative ABC transport system permease protein
MIRIALKMLIGDPVKYLGLIFGIAFATLLILQQTSIFVGLLSRAGAEVRGVGEATIWVMDPAVVKVNDNRPMRDTMLARVRGVPGIAWASPLLRGGAAIGLADGRQFSASIAGVDDATLIGGPAAMVLGYVDNLSEPSAIIVSEEGYKFLFPDAPLKLGAEVELNDRRAVIRGISKTNPNFSGGGIELFARYSTALSFINSGRTQLSFILAREANGVTVAQAAQSVTAATGLKAVSRDDFVKASRDDVIDNTGIPISIGTTVVLGIIVGIAIVGLTFTIFIAENLKQFGALKAIGVSNGQLVGMVLTQAALVGVIGYTIGFGLAGWFFLSAEANIPTFQGFFLPWEVALGTAGIVVVIITIAALIAMRRVLVIDPAIVFRG